MFKNAVHIHDPIMRWGRCSFKSFSAADRLAGSLKSHGWSSEFVVVRSSATPGITPSLGCWAAVAMTLGAECGLVECDVVAPGISHLDVWAGLSSFSDAFKEQSNVIVKEEAWIEWAPVACVLLQHFMAAVYCCQDFFSYAWSCWKFKYELIVTAGPSCCPFSVSGKRLRQNDPRACQGFETAKLAVDLGALVLIIENVANFVDEDHIHHLMSDIDDYLQLNGMVAIGVWRLFD